MIRILKQNGKTLILVGLIILSILFFISIVMKPPIRNASISNQASILLKVLDCDRTMQSESGWNWNSINISQEELTPSFDNGYLTERATCNSLGTYSPNWITHRGAMLFYGIRRYRELVNLPPDTVKTEDFIGLSSFHPKFLKLGKKMYVDCLLNNSEMFSCYVAIQYNYVSTYVRLVGDRAIDIPSIEDFVNRLLLRLDGSIETIDYP